MTVREEYEPYFNDFFARDFDATTSHFQVPTMWGKRATPAVALSTQDEVSTIFESMPIQDGYSYSLIGRIDISRLAESVFYRARAERRLSTRHLYRYLEHSYALTNYIDKQQLIFNNWRCPNNTIRA